MDKGIRDPLINSSAYGSPEMNKMRRRHSFEGSQRSVYEDKGCVWWKILLSLAAFIAFLYFLEEIIKSGIEHQAALAEAEFE